MSKLSTTLVASGRGHEAFGSVNPPTYRASTILFDDFDGFRAAYLGKVSPGYGRQGNPTTEALAQAVNALIDADYTVLTPSGLQAITLAFLSVLSQGDHVLIVDSVYGPTRAFCNQMLQRYGVEASYYAPETTPEQMRELIRPNTRLICLEAPGSLTLEMQDIAGLCAIAHEHDCLTMLDYTWATPLHVKPFTLGVDIAIQAVTKYMAGHSDVLMGAVSCKDAHRDMLSRGSYQLGNCISGDDASLVLRGMRTMDVRLRTQCEHAFAIIDWMQKQPAIARIIYPPLESDEGHDLWQQQMTGGAALFTAVLEPDISEAHVRAFTNALGHIGLGFSWGGYESLLVPFKPAEVRSIGGKWQPDQWCLRLHIGLEAKEDLLADLANGFAAMGQLRQSGVA